MEGERKIASRFDWSKEGLNLAFVIDTKDQIWLQRVGLSEDLTTAPCKDLTEALPIAQIRLSGEGSVLGTSQRLVYSALSHRLIYVSHQEKEAAGAHILEIVTRDPVSKLEVVSKFTIFVGVPVVRCTTEVENKGAKAIYLQALCSLSVGKLNGNIADWWTQYQARIPYNNLFREAQWQSFTLPQLGMDDCGSSDFHLPGTRAAIILSNQGTFSTTGYLPMCALEHKGGQECWMWQIEHSGAWRWELGNILNSLYLIAGGPTENEQWTKLLKPGESFESVPVALTLVKGTCEAAFGAMTEYRRRIRRKHADNEHLPIIFNDYMNCLVGDPNEEKVRALIQPARDSGAEYFVIDAGWYADDGDWWDTVGAWEPSTVRFPHGLKSLLGEIKNGGMIPGLWLEPEVIGINCPVADDLPDDAVFQRYGSRVVEQGRYQLDFRHPAVRARLDKILDCLITEYGVGYFKLDYNIDVTSGTDVNAASPGDGMLEHRRAYMSWINSIYDRFPQVILESCSSGGQRLDYHMLATHSIQSTSDQEDAFLYAAIAAAVPTAITPEQSASWAYPQPHWNNEEIAFTIINALLGRIHLSGRLDQLSNLQLQIVKDGMEVYKQIRQQIKLATPFWPLGLHDWHQDWLALGLKCDTCRYGLPCEECHRRKKRCNHRNHAVAEASVAEEHTAENSSRASPVRVGDYHPESILTELSAAIEGGEASQSQIADHQIRSPPTPARFRLSRTAPDSSFEKRQTEWWHHHRQRPSSVALPDHQRVYLDAAGAFLILPKLTTDILIPTYVSILDGLVPVVDGAQILRDYNNGQVSRYLIRAMCLVISKTEQAAPFLRLKDDDPVLAPLEFAKRLYEGLTAATQAELEHDRIVQIQILALLSLYNDGLMGVKRASAHLSQAIHDSWFISLHYHVAGNPIQSRCNMLWWSLRCFDKLNKFIVGAPFMISDADIQIARPEAGDSYQSRILTVLMNLGDLLVTVEEIYNPNSSQDVGGVEDFPSFSDLTKQVTFNEFQKAHQNYLEIWYHVAAMLSCRSSLPSTIPYQRRLRSAERIQDMMSYGRHAYLPPLPLIPYAMAMSLTVKYRDLRENKVDFKKGRHDLQVRLEILEALGESWTTAKAMARLARKAFKALHRKDMKIQQNFAQRDVARQTKSPRRVSNKQKSAGLNISATENNALRSDSMVHDGYSSRSRPLFEQDEQPEGIYFVATEGSGQDIPESSGWNVAEQNYNWPAADMYFNFEPDPFYDLSSFGMGNVFRDLSSWGVSPDLTDGTNSATT